MEYILLAIANIFTLRELYKTIRNLEAKKYIYNNQQHSLEHFNYLLIYNFALLILWFHIFWYTNLWFTVIFLSIATIILMNHIRKERKHH